MNDSPIRWIIHELTPLKVVRLGRGKAVANEAVVYYYEIRHNAADVMILVRPKGKKCRQLDSKISFYFKFVGSFYEKSTWWVDRVLEIGKQ